MTLDRFMEMQKAIAEYELRSQLVEPVMEILYQRFRDEKDEQYARNLKALADNNSFGIYIPCSIVPNLAELFDDRYQAERTDISKE